VIAYTKSADSASGLNTSAASVPYLPCPERRGLSRESLGWGQKFPLAFSTTSFARYFHTHALDIFFCGLPVLELLEAATRTHRWDAITTSKPEHPAHDRGPGRLFGQSAKLDAFISRTETEESRRPPPRQTPSQTDNLHDFCGYAQFYTCKPIVVSLHF